jgi:AhpD family alkylhydroperoxidase
MARITLPDGDSLEIVRALSLRPEFAKAVGGFEQAVWGSGLDWRLHELVRMQVAIVNQCTVCLGWRTPQAVEAGVTDELLAGVASFETFPDFTAAERVALEYAKRFCTDSANIDDALLERLAEHLDAGQIVELTLVIGKYMSMGRFM